MTAAVLLAVLLTGTLVPPGVTTDPASESTAVGSNAVPGRPTHWSPAPGDRIERSFEWDHAGRTWSLDVAGDQTLLDGYAARDRLLFKNDYRAFALDLAGDGWVEDLAHRLDGMYRDGGIEDDTERLHAVLAFVQHLPYAVDAETTGETEWPRYPMETVFADANDCEDTSVLFANLAQALGFDAILIHPPRHMAVGVALPHYSGVSVHHEGKDYFYAETTGPGWKIGKVPRAFAEGPLRPLGLEPRPILSRPTMETEVSARTVLATLTVHNVGNAPAEAVVLGVEVHTIDGGTWSKARCAPEPLDGGRTRSCQVLFEAPPDGPGVRIAVSARSPDAPNRFTTLEWTGGAPTAS